MTGSLDYSLYQTKIIIIKELTKKLTITVITTDTLVIPITTVRYIPGT